MINTIVFDVGRVLIDFAYDSLFNWMREQGAQIADIEDFVDQVGLPDYERNLFDDCEFLDRLGRILPRPVSRVELMERWNDLFTPIPSMLTLAEGLKADYRVFLLSNTSGLHWRHLWQAFDLERFCHDGFASYQLRAMKPEASIYQQMETRLAIAPETTVFIDDNADNVEGAQQCGWMGIHHCCPRATRERLRLLGVRLPEIPPETA